MIRNSSGQFVGQPKKAQSTRSIDLPTSNKEVIELYQRYQILPKEKRGIKLTLKQTDGRRGDKINNGWTFHVPGTKTYPSVRPYLQQQDKLPLVLTHRIIYRLLLKASHQAIAQELGWQYVNANDNIITNTAPITRLRSN
jgi:hypothetical protein